MLPLLVLFTFTIPDVRRSGPGKYYYASFVLSILWIGVSSFCHGNDGNRSSLLRLRGNSAQGTVFPVLHGGLLLFRGNGGQRWQALDVPC